MDTYDVMWFYFDDYRLASWAIVELGMVDIDPTVVYIQLLKGEKEMIPILEQIVNEYRGLNEWCETKRDQLDNSSSHLWSAGDLKIMGEL